MQFSQLVTSFEKLEKTSSSNEMTTILAGLFREAGPVEIGIVAYFVLGRIGPDYAGVQLGLGENMVRSAIALATGVDESSLERMKDVGDLGDLAVKAGGRVRKIFKDLFPSRAGITVADVRTGVAAIAAAGGPGSQERKMRILAAMIAAASSLNGGTSCALRPARCVWGSGI
jgi:DNA ligase-1